MRRRLLLCATALGAVVAATSATGIFAVFTDRATTGTNTATSGARPKAADLKIATGSTFNDCQTFSDDLATGIFSMSNVQPGDNQEARVCVKNAGSSELNVTMKAIDLTDSEAGCTGDEEAAGDTTCGAGAGELSSALAVSVAKLDCTTGSGPTGTGNWLNLIAGSSSLTIGAVPAGTTACLYLRVTYGLNVPANQVLIAQSDTVTWRLAFDGATA